MMLEAFSTLLVAGFLHASGITMEPVEPKGVYVTANTANTRRFQEILDALTARNLNLIVFDVQTGGGKLAHPSQIQKVQELGMIDQYYDNLKDFVFELRKKNIYTAARLVLFKQHALAYAKPDWTIRDKATNLPFKTREGPIWLDPSHPELKRYLFDIVRELAETGVHEIQFDYVRFPSAGVGGYIGYTTYDKNRTREQIITDFIKEVSEIVKPYGTKLSLDLFGVIVWNNGFDARLIGQNVSELSKYVDVIYPMVYPSHFGPGFGGHSNPGDDPYYFVNESLRLFQREMKGNRAKLRPWLQAFPYRTSRFGRSYVLDQIRGANNLGIEGFALWSAGNHYEDVFP